MRGDASDYAALGLEPGADRASVERAYKRLIKLHHPDQGGDASMAAEINRAYRELRGADTISDPLIIRADASADESRGWVLVAILLVVALAVLLTAAGPVTTLVHGLSPTSADPPLTGRAAATARAGDTLDQALHRDAIAGAVQAAVRISAGKDESALLNASRECQRALHVQPSVVQLDRCAAFDDAVVQLQDRDPSWDGGPFSQPAVSRRQWSAASALSNDYLAVDGRLDRIRLEVELALAQQRPQ
jgi:hypothetical protein